MQSPAPQKLTKKKTETKKEEVTTDTTKIQRSIRDYYK
jgi:hypothetical protein